MYVEYAAVQIVHTDHLQILVLQITTFRHNVEHQLMLPLPGTLVPFLTVILCGK